MYGPNEKQANFHVPVEYTQAVRRAGGLCVLLPPGEAHLDELLDRIDGVVMAGGGDINPQRYGSCGHELVYMVDDSRDASEITLVQKVLTRRIPLLAICRGMQVLNVALGGSLHPHVPDAYGESVLHRLPPRDPTIHPVTVEPDSHLARAMGVTRHGTMSWHHQALDRIANGLRVVARADDGVVEACEVVGQPQCLAVQWHPELTAGHDPTQQHLFEWLIDQCHHEKAMS